MSRSNRIARYFGWRVCFTGISLVYGVIALAINYGDRQNNIILLYADRRRRPVEDLPDLDYQPLITKAQLPSEVPWLTFACSQRLWRWRSLADGAKYSSGLDVVCAVPGHSSGSFTLFFFFFQRHVQEKRSRNTKLLSRSTESSRTKLQLIFGPCSCALFLRIWQLCALKT